MARGMTTRGRTKKLGCMLLSLPPEIRNRIWEYTVIDTHPSILKWTKNRSATLNDPPVTRTCRQIRTESHTIFYARNTFTIQLPSAGFDLEKRGRALRYFPLMRNIRLMGECRHGRSLTLVRRARRETWELEIHQGSTLVLEEHGETSGDECGCFHAHGYLTFRTYMKIQPRKTTLSRLMLAELFTSLVNWSAGSLWFDLFV